MYRKAQDKMGTEIQLKAEQATKYNLAIREAENRNFRNSQSRFITYRRTRQGPNNFTHNKITPVNIHDKCHPTSMQVRSVFIAITSQSNKY
jgi:hypothetical protein